MTKSTKDNKCCKISRRGFMAASAVAGSAAALGLNPIQSVAQDELKQLDNPDSIKTNIAEALAAPKNELSMPGKFPGRVVQVVNAKAVAKRKAVKEHVKPTVDRAMCELFGVKDHRDAWSALFNKDDIIGIHPNPVGGKISGACVETTQAVIESLEEIGVPRKNMIMWERYLWAFKMSGYLQEDFPGVKMDGFHWFEIKDGKRIPRGLEKLDMDVYYSADRVLPDEKNEMAYMLKNGPESYYPKLLTQEVTKNINIPCLKHHSAAYVTLALKNLSYGAMSNCVRGHEFIDKFVAESCAFPPIRDKNVLNIMDGLRGQYYGGPSPNARYVWENKSIYASTDPVAMDTICFQHILDKQIEKKMINEEEAEKLMKKYDYLVRAENLGLGIHKSRPIDHPVINMA